MIIGQIMRHQKKAKYKIWLRRTLKKKTSTTQSRQLFHNNNNNNNYPVTELSFKLKDIYRNALNCAENRGTSILEMSDIHVKAYINFTLPF